MRSFPMNASARIETEAEAGTSVHFSLDVNERLVTNSSHGYDDVPAAVQLELEKTNSLFI
jgi:hypothetical protein